MSAPAGVSAGIPIAKVITLTGAATVVLAPFGAFSLNLSAITAAMCMGPPGARRIRRGATPQP
jgi:benzoate membrane transport protein